LRQGYAPQSVDSVPITSEERRCVGLIWPNPVASLPARSALRVGCDQQGKTYFRDGSSSVGAGYRDGAANLTHEDCHVVGTMFPGDVCRVLLLHSRAIVGNRQFDLVAIPFGAQHDVPSPVRESVIAGLSSLRSGSHPVTASHRRRGQRQEGVEALRDDASAGGAGLEPGSADLVFSERGEARSRFY
jgi:hypothetical protein